jgi:hypothetical protein
MVTLCLRYGTTPAMPANNNALIRTRSIDTTFGLRIGLNNDSATKNKYTNIGNDRASVKSRQLSHPAFQSPREERRPFAFPRTNVYPAVRSSPPAI